LAAQPRVALAITLFLALIVAAATLTPSENMPSAPGGDKLHHFLAFGAVAFPMSFSRPRAAIWVVLTVAAYGAIIEVIQPHVGRHGDVMDALANAVGAVCGAILGFVLNRWIVR
jgi:VanZ family protein